MKKNFIYNLLYQVFAMIIPLITIPYISRVLGADGIGEYTIANTYSQYFIMFGTLGLATYSSREIAYVRDEELSLKETFWQLVILRILTLGFTASIYFMIFILFNIKDNICIKISIINIIACMFDISWLFIGIENFKKVVIRNISIKLFSVFMIFAFIKNSNQVWLYTLIMSISQVIGLIIMWLDIPNEVKTFNIKSLRLKKHLSQSFAFFIPEIAIQVYTMLDKIMLGELTTSYEVGLYENSQRIIKLVSVITSAFVGVTIPKMSNLYYNGKDKEFKNMAYKTFSIVNLIVMPLTLGLLAISKNFVIWYFGDGFIGIEKLFYIGAFLIITLGWTSVLGSQVLVSMNRQKKMTIAVVCGAILNLLLNMILIKKYQSIGTTISSILAEYTGMLIMVFYLKDVLNIKRLFKGVFKYFIASSIMAILVYLIGYLVKVSIIGTLVQIVFGICIYFTILLIYKDKNILFILESMRILMKDRKIIYRSEN